MTTDRSGIKGSVADNLQLQVQLLADNISRLHSTHFRLLQTLQYSMIDHIDRYGFDFQTL